MNPYRSPTPPKVISPIHYIRPGLIDVIEFFAVMWGIPAWIAWFPWVKIFNLVVDRMAVCPGFYPFC